MKKAVELLRFCVVGVIATAIHYGVYLLMLNWVNHNVAYTIGYVLSFCCNYWLSSVFTFKVKMSVRNVVNFAVSHLLNYLFGLLLLNVVIWTGMLAEDMAPLAVFIMVIPFNFIIVRYGLKRHFI